MNKIIKNFKNIKYGPAPEDDTEVINWINKISSPRPLSSPEKGAKTPILRKSTSLFSTAKTKVLKLIIK